MIYDTYEIYKNKYYNSEKEYIKNIDENEFINTEHYVEILNFLEGDK